jgi:RNA polymerase sigma-70 factor (ECF subfamily)
MSSEPLIFDPLLGHLRGVANGDKVAAEALVRAISPRLFRTAYRIMQNSHDAEEITQETLIRLWAIARSWKSGQARIETWAYRVTTNLCFDRLKSGNRFVRDGEELDNLMDNTPTAEAELVKREITNEIDRALATLPHRQRAAIALTYFEGMSARVAGEALDVSVEAIESLLARAKRTLKQKFLENTPEILSDLVALAAT